MGRKVNPIGFRLGIVTDWESKWYAERNYTEQLHEDMHIRGLIMKELTRAGISRIELERSANKVDVTLHTIEAGHRDRQAGRERRAHSPDAGEDDRQEGSPEDRRDQGARDRCPPDRREHRRADRPPRFVPPAMKHAVQQAMRRGAKGVKIRLSGRLGGAEMSRSVDGDGWPRAAAHSARRHRLRRRPCAHHLWPHRRQGLGLQGDVLPESRKSDAQPVTADLAAVSGAAASD